MVRVEIIHKRLNKLDEYLAILKKIRLYDTKDFLSNPEYYGSAERFLHLAIEAVNDMGNYVIADLGLGVVNNYSDIPAILSDRGYIDSSIEKKWISMIGFRNILVHDYMDIDRMVVYNALQDNLGDFEEIKKVFTGFL